MECAYPAFVTKVCHCLEQAVPGQRVTRSALLVPSSGTLLAEFPAISCVASASWATLLLRRSDHAGENVEIEGLDEAGLPAFDGQRAHDGIVGAESQRGDVQFDSPPLRFLVEPLAETGVGRYAAADAESAKTGLMQSGHGLAHEAIDHRLLKAGGQIGDERGGRGIWNFRFQILFFPSSFHPPPSALRPPPAFPRSRIARRFSVR